MLVERFGRIRNGGVHVENSWTAANYVPMARHTMVVSENMNLFFTITHIILWH